jgi:hypothetical protein
VRFVAAVVDRVVACGNPLVFGFPVVCGIPVADDSPEVEICFVLPAVCDQVAVCAFSVVDDSSEVCFVLRAAADQLVCGIHVVNGVLVDDSQEVCFVLRVAVDQVVKIRGILGILVFGSLELAFVCFVPVDADDLAVGFGLASVSDLLHCPDGFVCFLLVVCFLFVAGDNQTKLAPPFHDGNWVLSDEDPALFYADDLIAAVKIHFLEAGECLPLVDELAADADVAVFVREDFPPSVLFQEAVSARHCNVLGECFAAGLFVEFAVDSAAAAAAALYMS